MIRRALIVAACVIAGAALPKQRANAQFRYVGYVAGTATTATDHMSYFVRDVLDGSSRTIYIDAMNDTTGDYLCTANPAGAQITVASITPTCLQYAGTMTYRKRSVAFRLWAGACATSPSGYAVRFVVQDPKTGKVLMNRTDNLDAGSTVYGCP